MARGLVSEEELAVLCTRNVELLADAAFQPSSRQFRIAYVRNFSSPGGRTIMMFGRS